MKKGSKGYIIPLAYAALFIIDVIFMNVKNLVASTVKDTSPPHSLAGGIGVVHFVTKQVGLKAQAVYNNYQLSNSPRIDGLGLRFEVQVHLPISSNN